jgi:hypothetical protein
MIGELSRAREQFESTDSELEFLIKPIREKHGFTDEVLQMAYNDFLNENSPII